MDNRIRISDLSGIYATGVRNFAENFLRFKAEKGENVVYSLSGQLVKLSASDALWIYKKLSTGLEAWEVQYLTEVAERGEDMRYWLEDDQTLVIPANLVLELFQRMHDASQ